MIIEKCLSILDENSDSVTYLTGKSGIFVTATEIYRDLGDIKNAKKMIEKYLSCYISYFIIWNCLNILVFCLL